MTNTFYFATEADLVFGGPASRAEGNLAAIRLLKKLEEEGETLRRKNRPFSASMSVGDAPMYTTRAGWC